MGEGTGEASAEGVDLLGKGLGAGTGDEEEAGQVPFPVGSLILFMVGYSCVSEHIFFIYDCCEDSSSFNASIA